MDLFVLAVILALFAAVVVGPSIGLAFIGDDYVFLDKTRTSSFADLWGSTNVNFGWYRPWAREVYFWILQRAFGANPVAFRITNSALWIVSLCVYGAIVRRLASTRTAAFATLGVAALAFWGTPLLWCSGSQDLWMLVLGLSSFLLFVTGRVWWALPPFALALLSKETAGVLPAILCAYVLVVERSSLGRALRKTGPFWSVLAAWAILHPTLRHRVLGQLVSAAELEHRPPWYLIPLKTIAASLNLYRIPHPQEVDGLFAARVLLAALLLVGGVWLGTRRHEAGPSSTGRKSLVGLAVVWAVVGWAPLLLPTIGWHAYYGCLGALGGWFGLALWLESRPTAALITVALMALLRGAQASTFSTDWGDETYFRRAGSALTLIHNDLIRQHPQFPPNSRVYFAEIPYHIGLIAGDSPALRVWYSDRSLRATYYSQYRPRAAQEPSGQDYFFRYDSTAGMVEVRTGPEDVQSAIRKNPNWERDHAGLGGIFMAAGDLPRAALEFEKISTLYERPSAAIRAAVLWKAAGDTVRSDSLLRAAKFRMRASQDQMRVWVERVEKAVRSAGEMR